MKDRYGKKEHYTHFFPINDALKIPRRKLREILLESDKDLSKDVYVTNNETYCLTCNKVLPKFSVVKAIFYGAGKLKAVFCLSCAKLPLDEEKVEERYYRL